MQQMIDGWRASAIGVRQDYQSEDSEGNFRVTRCADEASVILERLRALVPKWRAEATRADERDEAAIGAYCRGHADALEPILGPEERK